MPAPTVPKVRSAPAPRVRMNLRGAMRLQNLDEHKIAQVLKRQVNRLQRLVPKKKLSTAQEKLLLEVLKECAKIMEPASRANATQEPSAFQLVHEIPRPPRQASPLRDSSAHSGVFSERNDEAVR